MRHFLIRLLENMAARLKSPKDKDNDSPAAEHSQQLDHLLREVIRELRKIMIAQATLDASLQALTTAVDAAVAALQAANGATSTPDTVVSAYQAGVDAQTVRIATATPPPPTP